MNPSIRAALPSDLPAITEIQSASPGAAQWDPATYLFHDCVVASENSGTERASVVSGPNPCATPALSPNSLADQVLAFLVTRQTTPGEHEILNLAVHPSHRRRGLARQLLQHALTLSAGDWYLEVRRSNTTAIQLYTSLGFEQVAVRPAYYTDPAESGIVMKLRS